MTGKNSKDETRPNWRLIAIMVGIFILSFLFMVFCKQRRVETIRGEVNSKLLAIKHPLRRDIVYSIKQREALCAPEDGGPEIWVSIPEVADLSKGSHFILKGESENWDDAFTIIRSGSE